MSELFTTQLDNNVSDITKLNARGYSLSGSIAGDRKIVQNIKDTKYNYIASGNYDKTNEYIDSKTKHSNPLDNFVDWAAGGHGNAKKFDDQVNSSVEYLRDSYDTATSIPKYLMYGGLALLVLYIIKK